MDALLDHLAWHILSLGDAPAVAVVVRSGDGARVGAASREGEIPELSGLAVNSALVAECLATSRAVRADTRDEASAASAFRAFALESVHALPIVARDGIALGAVLLASRDVNAALEPSADLGLVLRTAAVLLGGGATIAEHAALAAAEARSRESEAKLAQREEDLRKTLEGLAEGVFIHRLGTLLHANRAALPMFGVTSLEALVGRTLAEFIVDPAERAQLQADVKSAMAGTPVRRQRHVRLPDGIHLVETYGSRIEYEGGPAAVVVLQDVTQAQRRQALQEQTERLASIGALAASVGHEINNPLTFVVANLDLLSEELEELGDGLPIEQRRGMQQMLEDARGGADRIRRIVRAMRTLARDSKNDRRTLVSIPETLEAAIHLTSSELRQRARLVRTIEAVPQVLADETGLTQVLVNLLTNAGQAIPEGAPDAHTIAVSVRARGKGHVVVEVRDDGGGIAPENLARIFDPFFTTKPVGQGTGLGLSVVNNIVRGMGGDIGVESELGRGTTFRVTLPVGDSRDVTPDAEAAPKAPLHTGKRVLIVDDEPALCRVLSRGLASRFHTIVAHDGEGALAELERQPFDVIISDIMMPGMDGPTLLDHVRDKFPSMADRMVFLTGGACTPRTQALVDEAGERVFEKPLNLAQIIDVVGKLAEASR